VVSLFPRLLFDQICCPHVFITLEHRSLGDIEEGYVELSLIEGYDSRDVVGSEVGRDFGRIEFRGFKKGERKTFHIKIPCDHIRSQEYLIRYEINKLGPWKSVTESRSILCFGRFWEPYLQCWEFLSPCYLNNRQIKVGP